MRHANIIRALWDIDDAMDAAGWSNLQRNSVCSPHGDNNFKVQFQDAFRVFLNNWTERSRAYCEGNDCNDSPLTRELPECAVRV